MFKFDIVAYNYVEILNTLKIQPFKNRRYINNVIFLQKINYRKTCWTKYLQKKKYF